MDRCRFLILGDCAALAACSRGLSVLAGCRRSITSARRYAVGILHTGDMATIKFTNALIEEFFQSAIPPSVTDV